MTSCSTRPWKWRQRSATGPTDANRFTKRALNQWLLQAAPIFDHSLALEMMGFFGKDLLEGVDAIKGKRPPNFHSDDS